MILFYGQRNKIFLYNDEFKNTFADLNTAVSACSDVHSAKVHKVKNCWAEYLLLQWPFLKVANIGVPSVQGEKNNQYLLKQVVSSGIDL